MASSRGLAAPRGRVYQALLDPADVARWRFPTGMTCEIHQFERTRAGWSTRAGGIEPAPWKIICTSALLLAAGTYR